MPDTSPTVRHRRLAAELRRLRENRELTAERAAGAIGWSRSKLVRIETAGLTPSVADVERIFDTYGGDEALKLALLQLARDIRKRGWWIAYNDVLPPSFAELEDAASRIRTWQIELVPGLLQTEDYARALIRSAAQDDDADRRLQVRMMRQTVLARQDAPRFEALLHEMVLRSPIGGMDVLRAQLASLRTSARRPNISVRILPNSVGIRPAIGEGSFTVFDFPAPLDVGVGHVESVAGDLYVEDFDQVERCSVTYDRIADACLSEQESAAFIAALIEE